MRRGPSTTPGRGVSPPSPVAVGLLAFAARLGRCSTSAACAGSATTTTASTSPAPTRSLSGRMPYRDYVLLHPPGLVFLLTPFAALGRLVGDANGWAVPGWP